MDNYITFETSLKLLENNFPQPDFRFGQVWYETGRKDVAIVGTANFELFKQHRQGQLVFAARPDDILKELGKDYNLSFFEGLFYCIYDTLMGEAYSHENPAEACALAYLNK